MFGYSNKRLVALIFTALIPIFAILLGVLLLIAGTVANFSFIIAYFLVPLLTCGLLSLCIFSELFTSTKKWLSFLILLAFVVGMYFGLFFVHHEGLVRYTGDEAAVEYAGITDVNTLMPSLEEIGQPYELEYINYFGSQYIFAWDAYYLICSYDDEEYAAQKAMLEDRYIYQDGKLHDGTSACDPSVELNGFVFRALSIEGDYDFYYPKQVYLTGYCDQTKEIVYLMFYDIDLDYISTLDEFINDECGWKYVR